MNELIIENPEFWRLKYAVEQAEINEHQPPKVVVCGLLKAGKSSLLNALTGHLDDEFFVTNAARATTTVSSNLVNGVEYIDTPGIDATDGDDDTAWEGLVNADIILFVHHLRNGEIDTQELDFVKELQRRRPHLGNEMMVVFSNAESAQQNKEIVVDKLYKTLTSILDHCPPPFLTSFTTYRKGVTENKPALIRHSGFESFHQALQDKINSKEYFLTRKKHTQDIRKKLTIEVEKEILTRSQKKQRLQSERQANFRYFKLNIEMFNLSFVERIKNFNEI